MPVMNIIEAVRSALRRDAPRPARRRARRGRRQVRRRVPRDQGLYEEFGDDRVIDTPLAEAGIIGAAIGMALYGLRPVPEIQFGDFIFPAFDQIVNELAKFRYRSGGQYPRPVVIRTPVGGGIRGGRYHSQSPEAHFIHTPGPQGRHSLEPVRREGPPAGVDRRTIRCCSWSQSGSTARAGRGARGRVQGRARQGVRRHSEGTQVTLLAWSGMVSIAVDAAEESRPTRASPSRSSICAR